MNKMILMIAIASSVVLAGCGSSDLDPGKKAKEDVDKIIKKSEQDAQDMMESAYAGGQPGKITLKGIIVKKDNDKMLLDDRITVEQVGGTGKRGKVAVQDKYQTVLSEETAVVSAAESNKYINLGCDKLSNEEVEGLEQDTSEVGVTLSAKKIFICGDLQLSEKIVFLSAEQLILKDASLTQKSIVGGLNISTAKIVLNGANSIATTGADSVMYVLPAPSIDLTVTAEISGEGTLRVSSVGGSSLEIKATKTK